MTNFHGDIQSWSRFVRDRAQDIEDRAVQIGHMCVAWSSLELDLTILLSELTKFPDAPSKNILLGSLELKSKIGATKALGFSRKPNDEWFHELEALLNEIDNVIRPERNRMIHDFWMHIPDSFGKIDIIRAEFKPKIAKTQSYTKELTLVNLKNVSTEDIQGLVEKIFDANARILYLKDIFSSAS